ncbi:MAG: ATP-binding protein, partial [Candidatus Omnitrophota bacterium]
DRIMQVVINILSNAIKFTRPKKEAVIEVGSKTEKEKIIYYVKDNGVGFDAKYKDKLFNVFQRLHRAEEFEGTGIGLANIKRIIAKHGGEVWAESELGKGATFYFSLPKK